MKRNRIDPARQMLIEAWQRAYRNLPPKGLSEKTLQLAQDYNRQASQQGGLGVAAHRHLLKLAHTQKANLGRQMTNPHIKPGARLVRQWKGQTYVVDILDKGYLWQEQIYGSLSEIARTITGARWSGPRFFGV
jgi:Protein of unknown function (DUF2924)